MNTHKCGRLVWHVSKNGAFVRFGDHGLRLVSHKRFGPLFTERANRDGRRYWHFGHWCLATLAPMRHGNF